MKTDKEYARYGPISTEAGVEYIFDNQTQVWVLLSSLSSDQLLETLDDNYVEGDEVNEELAEDFATINAIALKQIEAAQRKQVESLKRGNGRENPEPQIVGTPKCALDGCLNFASEDPILFGCCSRDCRNRMMTEQERARRELTPKLCQGENCGNLTDGSDYCSWECVPWDTLVDADPGKGRRAEAPSTDHHIAVGTTHSPAGTYPAGSTTTSYAQSGETRVGEVKTSKLEPDGKCRQCGEDLPPTRMYYCLDCSKPASATTTYARAGGWESVDYGAYGGSVWCEHWRQPFDLLDGLTIYCSASRDEPTDAWKPKADPGFLGTPDFGVYFDDFSWRPEHAIRTTGFQVPGLEPNAGNVVQVPWPDMSTPSCSIGDFRTIIRWTLAQLRDRKVIDIGCLGGHGRTGTFLACLLTEQGMPARQAIAKVRRAHCLMAIETEQQTQFIHRFGKRRHLSSVPSGHGPYLQKSGRAAAKSKSSFNSEKGKHNARKSKQNATAERVGESMDSAGIPNGS